MAPLHWCSLQLQEMPCHSKKSSKAKIQTAGGHTSFTKIIEDSDEGSEWEIDSDDEDMEGAKKSLQGLYPLFHCRNNGTQVCSILLGGVIINEWDHLEKKAEDHEESCIQGRLTLD